MGATDALCDGLGEAGDVVCETEGVGEGGTIEGLPDKIGLGLGFRFIPSRAVKMELFAPASFEVPLF